MKMFSAITWFARLGVITAAGLVGGTSFAQSTSVDHLTQDQLISMAKGLEAKAQTGNGSASEKLNQYPNHFTMIALREKSGGAEVHANYADFFFIVDGRAKLISGGTVQNGKSTGEGETLGTALQGGLEQALGRGDVVHIPAGVPHQLLLNSDETLTYFVIKVKEK